VEKQRNDDMTKFMAELNERRETASKEATTKIEGFLGEMVKDRNELMKMKMNLVESQGQMQKEHLDELRQTLQKEGVSEGTLATVMRGLGDVASRVTEKLTSPPQGVPQGGPQIPPHIPQPHPQIPPGYMQQANGGATPEIPQPNVERQSQQIDRQGEIQHGAPFDPANPPPAVKLPGSTNTSNDQTEPGAVMPVPGQNQGENMALLDTFANEGFTDILEMMSQHVQNNFPPEMLADLLIQMMDGSPEVQYAISGAICYRIDQIVGASPNLPTEHKQILTSDDGQRYFEQLKGLIVTSFQKPPIDEDDTEALNVGEGNESPGVPG
jgi:hypothetical protein